jgi:MscS family membrane protein
VPLALVASPFLIRFMIARIFALPGAPALMLRGVFAVIGYVGLMWLVAQLLTKIGELVVKLGFREARPLKKQLVRVIFRIATIVVVTGIAITAAQRLGVPVAGLIAGVGVGGLAIALAAQSTLENFIGGIILYADQPVRVGDICKFGSRRGTVEDVGLRSTRIRTIDKTRVTVPNADFAKMQLENLSERDRVLLREQINLRYETTLDQLRSVMSSIEAMLRSHDEIDEERLRVRLNGIGEDGFEIELYCYAITDAWPEFTRIREDVLLKAMEIIEGSGTRLALPTEIHYRAPGEQSNAV